MRIPTCARFALAAAALAGALAARPAAAQDNPRSRPEHFRGRRNPVTAGEALLWVPRVIFFPLQVMAEYGVRRPVRAGATFVELHHVPELVRRVTNPTPNFAWSPTFVADLGVLTSAGLRARWSHAFVPHNFLRMSGSTGGADFWHLAGEDRLGLGTAVVGLRGDFLTRPDRPFFGLGPYSQAANLAYYDLTRSEGAAFAGWEPSNHLRAEISAGYRVEHTRPGQPPALDPAAVARAGQSGGVPGYGDLSLLLAQATATLDSRTSRAQDGGLWLQLHGLYGYDTFDAGRRFGSLEGELEGAVEVIHPHRVLVGSVYAMDTAPFGVEDVPFTHQAILGHFRHQGFRWGRFIGPSAFVAEVRYHYPVWDHLDALWLASVGNVFDRHFANFNPALFTGTVGVGLRTRGAGHDAIELVAALGTNRFDQPAGVESVRVYVGINEGL